MSEEKKQEQQQEQAITLEAIKQLATENEDVQNWLQSEKDRHFSKGLETWRENNLSGLLEEEIKKRYPEETEEQRQLRELKNEMAQMKREKQIEAMKNQAYKQANEKGLPLELLDFFVAENEELTRNNLSTLEKVWNEVIQKAVEAKFKENGREPHQSVATSATKNPWKQETFNLTEQARLLRENPELAKTLQNQAKG